MIKIGASGFSYEDWVGPFYLAGLPAREQLAFYAREFSTVEINTTYYRVPAVRLVQGWADKTPDGFLFAVKAYEGLTHEREHPDFASFVAGFVRRSHLAPLGGSRTMVNQKSSTDLTTAMNCSRSTGLVI